MLEFSNFHFQKLELYNRQSGEKRNSLEKTVSRRGGVS